MHHNKEDNYDADFKKSISAEPKPLLFSTETLSFAFKVHIFTTALLNALLALCLLC